MLAQPGLCHRRQRLPGWQSQKSRFGESIRRRTRTCSRQVWPRTRGGTPLRGRRQAAVKGLPLTRLEARLGVDSLGVPQEVTLLVAALEEVCREALQEVGIQEAVRREAERLAELEAHLVGQEAASVDREVRLVDREVRLVGREVHLRGREVPREAQGARLVAEVAGAVPRQTLTGPAEDPSIMIRFS